MNDLCSSIDYATRACETLAHPDRFDRYCKLLQFIAEKRILSSALARSPRPDLCIN